jgi:hypothetical protein
MPLLMFAEPQGEKKGIRAIVDAGVETLTSIIKHLTKFGYVCREELMDKAAKR